MSRNVCQWLRNILLFTPIFVVLGCGNKIMTSKEPSHLMGSKWQLTSMNDSKIISSDFADDSAFFILNANNDAISGFSGCNNFFGRYQLQAEQNNMSVSNISSTRMACMNSPVNEREFFTVLEQTQYYQINHNKLTLLNSKMKILATFKAAE